jgi:hypothetical protein
VVRDIIDSVADRDVHVWCDEQNMFPDELGENVRNALAIWGKYLHLSTQDQDVAYRDE